MREGTEPGQTPSDNPRDKEMPPLCSSSPPNPIPGAPLLSESAVLAGLGAGLLAALGPRPVGGWGLGAGDRALAPGGPLPREAEREVPAQRRPALPVSGTWAAGGQACVLGAEGSPAGGEDWGTGSDSRFFQA